MIVFPEVVASHKKVHKPRRATALFGRLSRPWLLSMR